MVDNVPLLVSLFTDCTATTTREMISIMQDYGEVVCVIGSSANADNVGIFIQANARLVKYALNLNFYRIFFVVFCGLSLYFSPKVSYKMMTIVFHAILFCLFYSIAVEPLYPQVCQNVSVCRPTDPDLHGPSPIYISKLLNSIPCSVSICREDSFSIFYLIMKVICIKIHYFFNDQH